MRVAFYTLGCKVNQYETEVLANQFATDGFDIVDVTDDVDIFVVNSCTVTGEGDKKTKQIIRKFKRSNPSALIALTGCFPQAFPDEATLIPQVQVIQGAHNKNGLLANVKKSLATGDRVIDIKPHKKNQEFEAMQTYSFLEHTRAFVKIQDGCDRYCSYCIIPKARGHLRSKKLEDIKEEITKICRNGYKEVVLVGINLSSYGKEDGYKIRLVDVIKEIAMIDGLKRIRLGSLEPELLFKEELLELSKIDKFCPQFHLALQSGCDETLKRMKRNYNTSSYFDSVENIRNIFDNPSITTDIMVGFVAETDEEFQHSLEFVKKIGFAKSHVFAYSIREGTVAANMQGQVLKIVKGERSKTMIEATKKSTREFLLTQIGAVSEVLFEKSDSNLFVGYTKNYTKVVVETDKELSGSIKKVLIDKVYEDYCIGNLIED